MKPVIVTTEFRGVFFGEVEDESTAPVFVELKNAHCCVYWESAVKGVLGLAATGPTDKCRIGPAVPSLKVWKITGIFECTPAAVDAWRAQPWK